MADTGVPLATRTEQLNVKRTPKGIGCRPYRDEESMMKCFRTCLLFIVLLTPHSLISEEHAPKQASRRPVAEEPERIGSLREAIEQGWLNRNQLVAPAALVNRMRNGNAPIIWNIGPEANIRGAVNLGMAFSRVGRDFGEIEVTQELLDQANRQLQEQINSLRGPDGRFRENAEVLIYCGCCPADHCPYVLNAIRRFQGLGLNPKIKILNFRDGFYSDPPEFPQDLMEKATSP